MVRYNQHDMWTSRHSYSRSPNRWRRWYINRIVCDLPSYCFTRLDSDNVAQVYTIPHKTNGCLRRTYTFGWMEFQLTASMEWRLEFKCHTPLELSCQLKINRARLNATFVGTFTAKPPKNLCKNTTTTLSRLYLQQLSIPRNHFSFVHALLVYTHNQRLTARMFVKQCRFGRLHVVAIWTPCSFRLHYCFRLCPTSCIDDTKRFRKSGQI